jgi:hypothetical protein
MKKLLQYSLFILLNLFFLFVTLYCLLFANTYLNDEIIPEGILWKDVGSSSNSLSITMRILVVLIEGLLFIYTFYRVNRLILRYDYNLAKPKSVAFRIAAFNFGIIAVLILYTIIYSI